MIAQLFNDNYKEMVKVSYNKLRNMQVAEDTVQDTFRIAQEWKEELLLMDYSREWLYKVLQNRISQEFRARKNFAEAFSKFKNELIVKLQTKKRQLPDSISNLTKDEFNLLKMVFSDGYSIKMVANELGISKEACRKRIQRAKDKVRNYE